MKTSEISQNRNVYLFESAIGRENMEESTEKRKVLENIPGMKITISQEGLAACEEAAKNRQGNVGAMTGWEGGRPMQLTGVEVTRMIRKTIRAKSIMNIAEVRLTL